MALNLFAYHSEKNIQFPRRDGHPGHGPGPTKPELQDEVATLWNNMRTPSAYLMPQKMPNVLFMMLEYMRTYQKPIGKVVEPLISYQIAEALGEILHDGEVVTAIAAYIEEVKYDDME